MEREYAVQYRTVKSAVRLAEQNLLEAFCNILDKFYNVIGDVMLRSCLVRSFQYKNYLITLFFVILVSLGGGHYVDSDNTSLCVKISHRKKSIR